MWTDGADGTSSSCSSVNVYETSAWFECTFPNKNRFRMLLLRREYDGEESKASGSHETARESAYDSIRTRYAALRTYGKIEGKHGDP